MNKPPGLLMSRRTPADRATGMLVVDLDPHAAAPAAQSDADRTGTVDDGVGDQLADDELSKPSVLGPAAVGQDLGGSLTGPGDLSRLRLQAQADGHLSRRCPRYAGKRSRIRAFCS
jgi:hypothetical protein